MNITNITNNNNIIIYDSHLYFFMLLGLSSILGFLYLKKKRNDRQDIYSNNNISIINDISAVSDMGNANNNIFSNLNKNNIEKEESDSPPTYNEVFKNI